MSGSHTTDGPQGIGHGGRSYILRAAVKQHSVIDFYFKFPVRILVLGQTYWASKGKPGKIKL